MKLCIQNIIDWLTNKNICGHSKIFPGKPILKTVKWLTDDMLENGILYVVPSTFPTDGTIVTYEDGILYYENHEPEDIFNELINIFRFYNAWEYELLETSFQRDSLTKLLITAQKIFSTNIVFINESNVIVAQTPDCTPDILYAIQHVKKEHILLCGTDDFPYEDTLEQHNFSSFFLPTLKSVLWYTEYPIGEIVVFEYSKPLNSGIIHMLNVLTNIISNYIALNPEKYISVSYLEKEFIKMINGKFIESDNFLIALHNLDWNLDDGFRIITLSGFSNFHEASDVANKLRSILANAYFLHHQEYLTILLNENKLYNSFMLITNFIREMQYKYFVGISLPFYYLKELFQFYRQALFALQYAQEHKQNIVLAQQIVPAALSQMIHEISSLQIMIHPDISALTEYDRRNQTNYLLTFKAFILSGCNHLDSSKKLGLHQNTLRYRIKRIEEIICGNLYDIQYREDILYSLLVAKPIDP